MSKEIKVGILVVVSLALAVFLTFAVKDFSLFEKEYRVNIVFTFVKGLTIGAPVKLSGVNVGEVKEIEILEEIGKIRVGADIKEGTILHRDSNALIVTAGLMGEQYIEISFGSSSEPALKDGDKIDGFDPIRIEEIAEKGNKIAGELESLLIKLNDFVGNDTTRKSFQNVVVNLDSLTGSLDKLLTGEKEGVSNMIANLVEASTKLNQSLANVDKTMEDISGLVGESRSDIRDTIKDFRTIAKDVSEQEKKIMANLSELSESLKNASGNVENFVSDNQEDLQKMLDNFIKSSESFKESVENIRVITEKLEKGEGPLGKLLSDSELETKVNETIDSAHKITSEVNRSFNSLKLVGEWRYFSSDLDEYNDYDDRGKRWRSDLGIGFSVGERNVVFIGANDIGVDNQLELLVGRKFFDNHLTLKAGVIESEAAVGADVDFTEWAGISAEYLGFTDNRKERVDLYARLRPIPDYPWGWIVFGVDDVGDDNVANVGFRLEY